MVKNILKNKSATSAPGEDGIMYGVLAKMPCTHYFLATLYNKLDQSGEAPDVWSNSNVTLAFKDGLTNDASNFRMIALTSCLSKPYHIIKAERLSSFMVENQYIDPSVQKGLCRISTVSLNTLHFFKKSYKMQNTITKHFICHPTICKMLLGQYPMS